MAGPTHPGIILNEQVIVTHELNKTELAEKLEMSRVTLNRILKGSSRIDSEFAWKMELLFGISARALLSQQMEYDLWKTRQNTEKLESWPFPEQQNNDQLSFAMA